MFYIFVDENGPVVRPMEASTPVDQVAQGCPRLSFIYKMDEEDHVAFFLSIGAPPKWIELTNSGFHSSHGSSPAWLFGLEEGWTQAQAKTFLDQLNLSPLCLSTNETLE